MTSTKSVVFIIDDDASMREALPSALHSAGFRTEVFASAQEFLSYRRPDVPSCVVADVRMRGMTGLELHGELVKQHERIPIILMAEHADVPTAVRAIKSGAADFLAKPFSDHDIIQAVQNAFVLGRRARQPRGDDRPTGVHEREAAEALVEEANARLALMLDSVTDNLFALSSDWRFTYLNKHAARQMTVLGKDPAQLVGKVLWDEFPVVPNEVAVRRVMTERIALTDELYYAPLKEWVENHMCPSADGGMVCFQRYITQRKLIEEKLQRSEAHLAQGQRISHTGSWTWNASSGALFWSVEHYRIFGLDHDKGAITTSLAFGMIHALDRAAVKNAFQAAVDNKCGFEVEFRMVRADGVERCLRSVGRPVVDDKGRLVEFVGTVADITERTRTEQELRTAQADLARIHRVMAVGQLAASIAHEVNQPLAAVITNAYAGLRWLERGASDLDETRAALRRIVLNGERASDVIQRIRALVGKAETKMASVRVSEAIQAVVLLANHDLSAHGVALRTVQEDELPPVVADLVQLQQVLLNLIMNGIEAIGAQPGGTAEIVITAGRQGDDHVRVSVRDSGIGINPEIGERMFDAFYTTKARGMGLGLSISRSIIDAHGGELRVAPSDGTGSTFTFTLPIHKRRHRPHDRPQ